MSEERLRRNSDIVTEALPAEEAESRQAPPTNGFHAARILAAEDDANCLRAITLSLSARGYRVETAQDGLEAWQMCLREPPDLLLVDYQMPRMDGLELSRRLRARRETRLLPIIMLTGVMGTDMAVKALDAGVSDFIAKPASSIEIEARVRAHLRAKFLVDQLEDLEDIIKAMCKTVEAKDPYTIGHSERVAQLAVSMGESLGLGEHDLRSLRLGALLHDIGKIGVPDSILQKPDSLLDEEREVLARHTTLGEEICSSMRSLTELAQLIRGHHEKLDGSGYPDGLKGGEISLLLRILTVSDIFDSITTSRPYNEPRTWRRAIEELRLMAEDGKLDRTVVEILAEQLEEDGSTCADF